MKKLLLLVLFALGGCVYHDIESVRPHEIGFDDSFSDRIFSIYCEGDGVNSKTVNRKCNKYASKFAFNKGYLYYTVLDQNVGSTSSVHSFTTTTPVTTYYNDSNYGYQASTIYIPQTHMYTSTSYYKNYIFVLINEDELKSWNNYFKVSDYYTPEAERKQKQ